MLLPWEKEAGRTAIAIIQHTFCDAIVIDELRLGMDPAGIKQRYVAYSKS